MARRGQREAAGEARRGGNQGTLARRQGALSDSRWGGHAPYLASKVRGPRVRRDCRTAHISRLRRRPGRPDEASTNLVGWSNSLSRDDRDKRRKIIADQLGITEKLGEDG